MNIFDERNDALDSSDGVLDETTMFYSTSHFSELLFLFQFYIYKIM